MRAWMASTAFRSLLFHGVFHADDALKAVVDRLVFALHLLVVLGDERRRHHQRFQRRADGFDQRDLRGITERVCRGNRRGMNPRQLHPITIRSKVMRPRSTCTAEARTGNSLTSSGDTAVFAADGAAARSAVGGPARASQAQRSPRSVAGVVVGAGAGGAGFGASGFVPPTTSPAFFFRMPRNWASTGVEAAAIARARQRAICRFIRSIQEARRTCRCLSCGGIMTDIRHACQGASRNAAHCSADCSPTVAVTFKT